MKTLKNMTGDSLEQMIDYKVVDQNGDSIGTLHSLWSDPTTGAVEFLGVKTGWLFGQNHVVPAEKAELDESAEVVRLPYTETFIKEAPAISAEAEISEAEEDNIYQYYGLDRAAGASTAPGDNQPGVNYGTLAGDKLPEAIGGAAVAGASEAGTGGTQFGGPSATDADATLTSMGRLRRTSRPDSTATAKPTTSTMGESVLSDAGFTGAGTRTGSTTGIAEPESFATSNMFGSTGSSIAPVAADSAGMSGSDLAAGTSDALAEHFGSNVTDPGDPNMGKLGTGGPVARGSNPDLVTGEPGSHPVGTGMGALAAGAAGAAIGGAVGGPIGAPLGAAIGVIAGAVGGGYAGKGIAESINPTAENAYWQKNFQNAPYHESDYEYSDYAPAYRTGYEGYSQHAESGKSYSDVESDLEKDYNSQRGSSRLTWDKAKAATRDAWDRLKDKTTDATHNS